MSHTSKAFLAAVSVFFLTLTVASQTRKGVLVVTVKDELGGAIPGAQIVIRESGVDATAANRKTRTDERGSARIAGLSGVNFTLEVSAPGFKDYSQLAVAIRAGETREVDIILQIAPIESKVDIGENEELSAENPGAAAVLNAEQVAKLPNDQVELEKAIKNIGRAATGEDLPITVNGVEGAKIPPKAAIQQIRVNQNVFSAQYDGPYGAGIEIFTRSSVDKFSGYLYFTFADARLNARDPFLGVRVPYQSRNYSFSLSGPLFGKKANFYAYGNRTETDSSSAINAIILDASLEPTAFKQSIAAPSHSENLSMTVNADPTKKHKLYFNYYFGDNRSKNQNTGGFSLPSRANNSEFQNHYFRINDTYLVSANIVNQSRFLGSYLDSKNFGGSSEPAINVLDAFFGGGSQQEDSTRTFRFDASNETTWQMGRYALGFGLRVRGEFLHQNSANNFGGTFTFSGRIAPVLDANNEPVVDGDGNIVTTEIDSLESYRRTLLFRERGYPDQQIRELGGGANQLTLSGGNPLIEASQYDLGAYVQNSYKISDTVAASFGLRYEYQNNIASDFNFAPRFGVIWAPKAKEKQNPLFTLPRISVGYGLFYSRFGLNSTVAVRMASDPDRLQYLVTDTNALDLFPNVPTPSQLEQFSLPRTQRFIANDFETPYQSLLNISVLKKLPRGFSLSFTFSRGVTFRKAVTPNINAPLAGTFDPAHPDTSTRPFGNVGNIYETRSTARGNTTRYSLSLGFPQNDKFFASLRYNYFLSADNIVDGSGSGFDPYDFHGEFAPTTFSGRHNAGGYFYVTLPHKFNVSTDFSISSRSRFNIITGRDTNGDGFYSERPSFASDPNKPGVISTPYGLLDPNPAPGDTLIPRNLGRGTSNIMVNGSLSKTFGFNEDRKNKKPPKQTLTFGIRVDNVFNIINEGNPIGNMASPYFLHSLSPYNDGSIITINGAVRPNFAGRSLSLNIGFGF